MSVKKGKKNRAPDGRRKILKTRSELTEYLRYINKWDQSKRTSKLRRDVQKLIDYSSDCTPFNRVKYESVCEGEIWISYRKYRSNRLAVIKKDNDFKEDVNIYKNKFNKAKNDISGYKKDVKNLKSRIKEIEKRNLALERKTKKLERWREERSGKISVMLKSDEDELSTVSRVKAIEKTYKMIVKDVGAYLAGKERPEIIDDGEIESLISGLSFDIFSIIVSIIVDPSSELRGHLSRVLDHELKPETFIREVFKLHILKLPEA